ncbi:MAG: NADH-quinone oxidoreductase subunit J [Gemmatimonadales bacterium]
MTEAVFWIFAVIAVVAAVACILQRNPLAAALCLVQVMFALAAIFVLLDAQFIAAIQVLVYAGAVMVLFLFVIMLLNLGRTGNDLRGASAITATFVGVGLLAAELWLLGTYTPARLATEVRAAAALGGAEAIRSASAERGVVGAIAAPLFETYLVPFEITSVLLLTAIVGAVVLAKRRV